MEDIQKKALFSITLVTHVSIVGHGSLVFHRDWWKSLQEMMSKLMFV